MTAKYHYKKGTLQYDSKCGWVYSVKGEKMITIVRLPVYQKKEVMQIMDKNCYN